MAFTMKQSAGMQARRSVVRQAPGMARPLLVRPFRRSVTVVTAALKVGDKLEDYPDYFRVIKASDGKNVTLSSFKGKKPVVLFFYPKQGTPGCTKEACKFRDDYEDFTKAGAVVFGISSDSPDENAAWAKQHRLPFPLLTDANSLLRKSFGIKADFFGALQGRQTFVIDKNGVVVMSFNNQLDSEKHVSESLKALGAVAA